MELGVPELALSLLAIAAFVFAFAATRRYGSPLNPLAVHSLVYAGLYTVGSGLLTLWPPYGLAPSPALRSAAATTAWVAIVHQLGVALPFAFHGTRLARLFGAFVRAMTLDRLPRSLSFRWTRLGVLLLACAASYTALAVLGGGRMLWLTEPRLAYIRYRAGAGPFYVATQWALMFGFVYVLWYRLPRLPGTLAWLGVFSGLAYFTGSKHNVLSLAAIGICYYHFRVRPLTLATLFVLTPVLVGSAFALIFMQGSYADLRGATFYFAEYFRTTTAFISRFDEFGFQWGQGWLSSLWFFVPRGLFPQKPFEYGETLIHAVLFPGAAARGTTPGLLSWSLSYLDFGVAGVFVAGWIQGLWQRAAYEYYLEHRDDIFAFLLMVHFGLWAMFVMAPPFLLFTWLVAVCVLLRVRLVRPAAPALDGARVRSAGSPGTASGQP